METERVPAHLQGVERPLQHFLCAGAEGHCNSSVEIRSRDEKDGNSPSPGKERSLHLRFGQEVGKNSPVHSETSTVVSRCG